MDQKRFGCFDMPTPREPAIIPCIKCDGDGCPECHGEGYIDIPHCPRRLVDGTVMELLDLVGEAEDGNFPVGGGVGDQTEWFLRARDAVQKEHRMLDRVEEEEK